MRNNEKEYDDTDDLVRKDAAEILNALVSRFNKLVEEDWDWDMDIRLKVEIDYDGRKVLKYEENEWGDED